MYRPDGWENPYKKQVLLLTASERHEDAYAQLKFHDAYETGADAMLEGLIREAQRVHELESLSEQHIRRAFGKGTWVFIPEEVL